jgi:tetratricopeptide (TPR) repeat protein
MPKTDEAVFLEKAKDSIESDYVRAKDYLDKIENPIALNNKHFALYTYLSCRIADSLSISLPLHAEIQKATEWYMNNYNNDLITTRMLLFLGRSFDFSEEDYQAMQYYLKALTMAKDNKYYNEAGYISSYMGDLYSGGDDMFAAIKKYNEAANYFHIAGNYRSQAFAIRDEGRSWALVDSLENSMNAFLEARKIAVSLNDNAALSTILNGIGNIYGFMGDYKLAEENLLKALDLGSAGRISTINALVFIYLESGNLKNAENLIDSLSNMEMDEDYQNTLNHKYYQLYAAQKKYPEALQKLEMVFNYYQKSLPKDSKKSFHELEKKYDSMMFTSELDKMRIQRQWFILLFIISVAVVLLLIIISQYRILKVNKLIQGQDKEIQILMAKYYVAKNELMDKEEITTQYNQKEKEVELLSGKLKDLRRKRLLNSAIGRKLRTLASSVKPQMDKSLITTKMWHSIEKEVKEIYPEFELKLTESHSPELSESDWQYCCFLLFNFNSNEEGILLNINPHSARTRRSRIRGKLGIELTDEQKLYDYFTENLLS